jgi:hypothetical protein
MTYYFGQKSISFGQIKKLEPKKKEGKIEPKLNQYKNEHSFDL